MPGSVCMWREPGISCICGRERGQRIVKDIILKMSHITKIYPGVRALDNMSVEFERGEVHALLGENGAGKSTLIKVLAGAIEPDSGEICLEGKTYDKLTPKMSAELGIQVIYQETNLIPALSAAENVFLGNLITNGVMVNQKKMYQETRRLFDSLNININPKTTVKYLTTGQRQIVEIAKAISRDARIIVMDEPSSSLTNSEVEALFQIVKDLQKKGVTVIYISHRLEELFQICQRVTVMRDGQFIETLKTKDTNREELIRLMVGRTLNETYPERQAKPGETVLETRNLYGNGDIDINFQLRRGEILGFAGLVGAGRTELVRMLYGADPAERGNILLKGEKIKLSSPSDGIQKGIGLIPEDRKIHGVIQKMNIKDNITLANFKGISKFGIINSKKEVQQAERFRRELRIKTPSLKQKVKNLSGGNQQKVVLAKWLATNSQILIFDEPTRGIDVGAKQEIYKLMRDLAEEGKSIIMVSSDMEEILGMSDRIIVMYEGRITGEIERKEFSQEKIMKLASGQERGRTLS